MQIRAAAAESALLVPAAAATAAHYARLKMPVVILAGAEDRLIDPAKQSGRLHHTIAQSAFRQIPGSGHMVHQTNPDDVMSAIDEVHGLAA